MEVKESKDIMECIQENLENLGKTVGDIAQITNAMTDLIQSCETKTVGGVNSGG